MWVGRGGRGWVEVDEEDWAAERGEELPECRSVSSVEAVGDERDAPGTSPRRRSSSRCLEDR